MKRIMTDLIAAMLFFIAMTTQSCVRLDLKTADDTSDEAEIGFDIAWDKVSGTALPDSVYIAMNKVSDILKYSYETDSKGAFLPYTIEKDDTVVTHREYAEYGHYVMLAYHCDKDNYTLSGAQRFMKDKTISVRDFKATVKDLPEEELTAMRGDSKIDFNSGYRFIRTPGPVWAASRKDDISDTRENTFRFFMEPLQQKLTFAVKLVPENGVSIISVTAELSGVPATFSLLTGEVEENDLARVIFALKKSSYGYEGTVAVPGILPSANSSLRTGPGILRLNITARKDGVTKVLYPAINIGNKITSASLMESVPGSDGRRIAKKEARLELSEALTIGADSFSSEGGNDGVKDWFDSGYIDIEV